jgi:hypothetical protein
MKKHINFILIFFFFAIIPIVMIKFGTNLYINNIESNKFIKTFSLMEDSLKTLKRKITVGRDKILISKKIYTDINNLKILNNEKIDKIIDGIQKKYPDMVTIHSFLIKNLDFFDKKRKPKLKKNGSGMPKFSTINKTFAAIFCIKNKLAEDEKKWEQLDDTREIKIIKRNKNFLELKGKYKFSKARTNLIRKKVIGTNIKFDYIFRNKGYLTQLINEKFFYWNFIKKWNIKKNSDEIIGTVFIYIDSKIFNKLFSSKKIIENKNKELINKNITIEKVIYDKNKKEKLIINNYDLTSSIKKNISSLNNIVGKRFIYSIPF